MTVISQSLYKGLNKKLCWAVCPDDIDGNKALGKDDIGPGEGQLE